MHTVPLNPEGRVERSQSQVVLLDHSSEASSIVELLPSPADIEAIAAWFWNHARTSAHLPSSISPRYIPDGQRIIERRPSFHGNRSLRKTTVFSLVSEAGPAERHAMISSALESAKIALQPFGQCCGCARRLPPLSG